MTSVVEFKLLLMFPVEVGGVGGGIRLFTGLYFFRVFLRSLNAGKERRVNWTPEQNERRDFSSIAKGLLDWRVSSS